MSVVYKARVLSTGKKGVMVACRLPSGVTVTRHLIKGKGKHPDDAVPKRHAYLEARRAELSNRLEKSRDAIKSCEHLIKTPGTARHLVAQAIRDLPVLRAFILTAPADLIEVEQTLHNLRSTDPLIVTYDLGDIK